ncbi:unnamed protein product [Phytophthora lilii]|uniref:Unnamed protein product n=1 Tax=Phytophthora lilii TaxID=2077276 RepID=A0A9W6WMP9_9STRA|nr:unnamed protein product [Phytophthora lilii]
MENDERLCRAKFLKTVEIGSRSVWGSNAERTQCRYKAFAYQTKFGQPALVMTLTPNSDNSLVLAQYTGILSVDTLFDLLEARPTVTKKITFRGLLGDVRAYFGMVENQGRGTLHIQLPIWLNHCPPNSAVIMKIVDSPEGKEFRERVASYADSIVRNDLPISLVNYNCSSCGACFQHLIELPIPELARKDPTGRYSKARSRCRPAEPVLVVVVVPDLTSSTSFAMHC